MRTLYTADFVLPMDIGHGVIPDGAHPSPVGRCSDD
jgi:hypothetical protein